MARLDQFRRAEEATGGAFYSGADKERLRAEHTPLYLHEVTLSDHKEFGLRWALSISEHTEEGPCRTLALACNERRDRFFAELGEIVEPVGPLMLTKVKSKAGREVWHLVEWQEEEEWKT